MTDTTLGIILLFIALVLGICLQLAPAYIDDRSCRYVRPRKRKSRFGKGVTE